MQEKIQEAAKISNQVIDRFASNDAMSAPTNPPQTRRVLKPQPTIDPEEVDQQVKRKAHGRRIQAEDLVSGSYLHKVAAENLETFQKMAPSRPLGGSVSLSWASACSGSEGPRFALEAMADVYRIMGVACSFDHLFSCEINPEKRQWIQNLNKHMPQCMQSLRDLNVAMFDEPHSEEDPLTASMDCAEEGLLGGTDMDTPCVFGDIADLAGEYAHCHEHDGQCKVHDPDLFVIGTSCKDLSRANPSSAVRGQVVLGQSTSKGGSAQTFTGLKAFLEKHQPSMLLFENVDAIEDSKPSGGSNLEVLKSQLSALGYEGQVVKTDALEFGLPYTDVVCLHSLCGLWLPRFLSSKTGPSTRFLQPSVGFWRGVSELAPIPSMFSTPMTLMQRRMN